MSEVRYWELLSKQMIKKIIEFKVEYNKPKEDDKGKLCNFKSQKSLDDEFKRENLIRFGKFEELELLGL